MKNLNVTFMNSQKQDPDKKVSLCNGNILLHYDKDANINKAFLIISYRSSNKKATECGTYCSLLNLDTGFIETDEPLLRNTTIQQIQKLLNQKTQANNDTAVSDGQFIEIYETPNYQLTLSVDKSRTKLK